MSKIGGLKRIRISSIEETELTAKFLEELKNNPKICNHLHIPLQAGADEILLKMNRKYCVEEFKEKINKIREIRPDIAISTDVIVGFPSESEELFLKTIKTVKEISFSKVHVFPYSPRQNTKASLMKEQVLDKIKHERSKKLVNVSKELEKAYANNFLGQVMEILIEKSGDESIGTSSNYLKVKVKEKIPNNTFILVKITEIKDNFLVGERQK